jgi:hypothetical protein
MTAPTMIDPAVLVVAATQFVAELLENRADPASVDGMAGLVVALGAAKTRLVIDWREQVVLVVAADGTKRAVSFNPASQAYGVPAVPMTIDEVPDDGKMH